MFIMFTIVDNVNIVDNIDNVWMLIPLLECIQISQYELK